MLGKLEEFTILGVMEAGRNATAANVFKAVSESGGASAFGAVFTTLDRLEAKKYVKASERLVQTGTGEKSRKVYEVTGLGHKVLRESLSVTSSLAAKAGFSWSFAEGC
ncbi:MAG: PadR family transcriptional regulator [Proteobacteria bacterium]|nr:PadR family transcriptional regulator [Pseudomonadota bacterium]